MIRHIQLYFLAEIDDSKKFKLMIYKKSDSNAFIYQGELPFHVSYSNKVVMTQFEISNDVYKFIFFRLQIKMH